MNIFKMQLLIDMILSEDPSLRITASQHFQVNILQNKNILSYTISDFTHEFFLNLKK